MNIQYQIPLDEFFIECFSLEEFKNIVSDHSQELFCNLIAEKYESRIEELKVIDYTIIEKHIYFFLRWSK